MVYHFLNSVALHPRLGADSPLAIIGQYLLRDIAALTTQAELYDARKPPCKNR